MSRQPSDKTALATERRERKRIAQEHGDLLRQLAAYRGRASKAEGELAEWKARFDQLLKLSVARASGEPGDDLK
jgi:hypothetical protein